MESYADIQEIQYGEIALGFYNAFHLSQIGLIV